MRGGLTGSCRFGVILFLFFLLGATDLLVSQCQTKSTEPDAKAQKHEEQPQKSKNAPQADQRKSSERLFGVVPAFNVTGEKTLPPLTAGQKFKLAAEEIYDPFTFVTAGFDSAIAQAQNESESFGQGWAGYGKRFGVSYADQLSEPFFDNFFFPTLLHQDPRYYRKGTGSGGARFGYSITRLVLTRNDRGQRAVNWSKMLAGLFSGALSNAYYPEEERGARHTFVQAATNLGTAAVFNLSAEFWPDIRRKFKRKR